jgi:NADH-quinone oxidoreductase subunit L
MMPFSVDNVWEHWLHPLIKELPHGEHGDASLEMGLMGASVFLAAVSAFVAYHFYVNAKEIPKKISESIKPIYQLINQKYLVDELYQMTIIEPIVNGGKNIWYYIDVNLIDRCTYWLTDSVRGGGSVVKSLQNGNMQQYALYIGMGVVFALSIVLMR